MKPTADTDDTVGLAHTRDVPGFFLQHLGRYPSLSAAPDVGLVKRSRSHTPAAVGRAAWRPRMRRERKPEDQQILRRRPAIAQVIKRQRSIGPLRPTP